MRNNYAERKKCTTHFSVGEVILSLFVCAESRNLVIFLAQCSAMDSWWLSMLDVYMVRLSFLPLVGYYGAAGNA